MNPLEGIIIEEELASQALEGTRIAVDIWASLIFWQVDQSLIDTQLEVVRKWAKDEWGEKADISPDCFDRSVVVVNGKRVIKIEGTNPRSSTKKAGA